MEQAFALELLPFVLLLREFRDAVLPVLGVATEDALVDGLSVLVLQLQGVHLGAPEPVEGFRTVAALHRRTLRLTAVARELLLVNQVVECFADVDPLLGFEAEARVLIHFDAVLVKENRLAHQLGLLCVLVFAEGADKWLVFLLAEGTDFLGLGSVIESCRVLHEVVVFVGLGTDRVRSDHSLLRLFVGLIVGVAD